MPLKFCPEEIRCGKCSEMVAICGLFLHYSSCASVVKLCVIDAKEDDGKVECRFCKRKFNKERIERHSNACEWASRKRPVFDILKKRMPYFEELKAKISMKKPTMTHKYSNSKWQQQHLQLLKNLRSEEPHNLYSDYLSCPHCNRKFAPNIAENHIEICKNILNKPKPPPAFLKESKSPKKSFNSPAPIKSPQKCIPRPMSVISKFHEKQQSVPNILYSSVEEPHILQNLSPDLIPSKPKKLRKMKKKTKTSRPIKKISKVFTERTILKSNSVKKVKNFEIEQFEFRLNSGGRTQREKNCEFEAVEELDELYEVRKSSFN